MKKILILFFLALCLLSVFSKRILIPADTIVGLYHPFRDFYSKEYPRGIPFKNSLITDPVRQQYPWKILSVQILNRLEFPLWNPYTFGGYPLLANFQSSPLYPFNLFLVFSPSRFGWNIFILLQPFLAFVFMFHYLRSLGIRQLSCLVGSISFSLGGFFVTWLEWGNVLHTALWLPLILLSIHKIESKNSFKWHLLFVASLTFSFLAGHLQLFFYVFLFSVVYLLAKLIHRKKIEPMYIIDMLVFVAINFLQLFSTIQFIFLSSRSVDQSWLSVGWFVPWEHLIQFLIPDFFGNPATLNYWGTWNYSEFLSYIGVVPIAFALYGVFYKRDKRVLFYTLAFLTSLLFALPTFLGKLPFVLNIPFISTSQPTRLLFISDFCLAVLSAFGFDLFMKSTKRFPIVLGIIVTIFGFFWLLVFWFNNYLQLIPHEFLLIVKRNLIFPSLILGIFSTVVLVLIKVKSEKLKNILYIVCIVIITFDLLRLNYKFNPFVDSKYIFPATKTTTFLENNLGVNRYMTTDNRILPPNFSLMYKLQTVDGYDPLYLLRYAELIAASERSEPNISPPFGFNRIITPHNYNSKIMDLMGVKYILSLTDEKSPKLKKVYQEGETRVYENKDSFPRVFFVKNVKTANSKKNAIHQLFENKNNLNSTAIVEDFKLKLENLKVGKVIVKEFSENRVVLETENTGEGFLVLTDTFYPSWSVVIDKNKSKIYKTDYNFRGVFIPKGHHNVVFINSFFNV